MVGLETESTEGNGAVGVAAGGEVPYRAAELEAKLVIGSEPLEAGAGGEALR